MISIVFIAPVICDAPAKAQVRGLYTPGLNATSGTMAADSHAIDVRIKREF